MDGWSLLEGRYTLGNPDSPVAVCTLGMPVLDMPMDDISIKGPCVIENIGVEKVVKNLISNPKIRFLVLCGKKSKGHFTGQAFLSLKTNGMDENKKIIGAKGAMPFLRNTTKEEVERFQKQIEIVDLIDEIDTDKILAAVRECISRNPGPLESSRHTANEIERLEAEPTDKWEQDPGGFFIIHADIVNKNIVAEFYTNDKILRKVIKGKDAISLYKKIAELGIVSQQSHAFYLGREFAKAENALREEKEYIQD
ncbi:MAG: tetrahydromethanopterin S-methyltransferase subunit A [Candidatus Aenigmatarchaeota archaeon]